MTGTLARSPRARARSDDPDPALDPARRPAGRCSCWAGCSPGTLGHVLFLFLTAAVIAFLLNPLVRDLQRIRLPRGLAVAVVFLLFATAVDVRRRSRSARVVVDQTRSAADRVDDYLTVESDDRPDRRRAGHRPAPGVARQPRPRAHPDREAGDRLGRQSRRRRDLEATRRTRSRSRREPRSRSSSRLFSLDPDRRHRDLHAARHASGSRRRSTAASPRTAGCR